MLKYDFQLDLSEGSSTGKILKKITQGSRVLEFGCAAGRMTKYMHEALGCCVSIVELDRKAYEKASVYADDGICGNIMDMEWTEKFRDVRFDFIIFADVLEHLTDPDAVIREAGKLLSPEGMIIFSIPNITHGDIILKQMNERFDYTDIGLLDNTHVHFWGLENIRPFAERNGLYVYSTEGTLRQTGETEQKLAAAEISTVFRNILNERKCSSVYQFVVTLGKDGSKSESRSELSDRSALCKLYLDKGSDFNEADMRYVKAKQISWGRYYLEVCEAFSDIKRLRIDPVEGQSCIVKDLRIYQGGRPIKPVYGANIPLDSGILLTGSDPMIIAEFLPEKAEVRITAEFILMSDSSFCGSIIENYEKNYPLLSENSALRSERDTLLQEISGMKNENSSLSTVKETLLKENASLTAQKEELSGEITVLKEHNGTLASENASLENENDRLSSKLEKLEKQLTEITEALHTERARADAFRRLSDCKDRQLLENEQRYSEQIQQYNARINEHEQLIGSYKSRKCVRIADRLHLN